MECKEEIVASLTEFRRQEEKPSSEAISCMLQTHTLVSVTEPLKEKQLRHYIYYFPIVTCLSKGSCKN